jgi:hypothetical protein
MPKTLGLRRAYIDECERCWRETPGIKWDHKVINHAKTLANSNDAKRYINGIAQIWDISNKPGGTQFVQTLHLNADIVGQSSEDYMDGHYEIKGQKGECTYIYVVINNEQGKIQITGTYHHLEEDLVDSKHWYTSYAKEITIDWLKWKAVQGLQSMLPNNIAPSINWK